jgi:hypothetical protein
MVKSQQRVSGRLNTKRSVGEEKTKVQMWISLGQNRSKTALHESFTYHYYFQLFTVRRVDSKAQIWQDRGQVNEPLCELSSPTLLIAAGLLLAALLSIVGYRVFRRWVSHGLEVLPE